MLQKVTTTLHNTHPSKYILATLRPIWKLKFGMEVLFNCQLAYELAKKYSANFDISILAISQNFNSDLRYKNKYSYSIEKL